MVIKATLLVVRLRYPEHTKVYLTSTVENQPVLADRSLGFLGQWNGNMLLSEWLLPQSPKMPVLVNWKMIMDFGLWTVDWILDASLLYHIMVRKQQHLTGLLHVTLNRPKTSFLLTKLSVKGEFLNRPAVSPLCFYAKCKKQNLHILFTKN